ncbi:MAG: lipopolysaccharide transport periplasmic protein LptA [Rhodocyclaceae bacterium]|nr:lipopolysaccharide transport periplasmic protein LptA [Rhodocyclaceae bacterium]
MKITSRMLLPVLLAVAGSTTHAERADRNKPVGLEADRVSVDDKQKIQTFEGNVRLTQGTMSISTGKMVVRQDADGFQSGTAYGGTLANEGLARFKQKREGRSDFIEGEAERIEHDNRTEKTEFHGRARVKSGLDEVRGAYISYDGKTENYLVDGAGGKGRVTATIYPRDKTKPEATTKP